MTRSILNTFHRGIFYVTLITCIPTMTFGDEFVHHPAPKKPVFINEAWYSTLLKEIPSPPQKDHKEQANDVERLLSLQKSRSELDCARAGREVKVTLANFFGPPNGPLAERALEKLSPFFDQIRNDADFFIQKLKIDFPRERPFLYIKGLTPCVPKEVTGSYPSAHAVLSRLYALVISDIFPNERDKLSIVADQIALDRVLSGMHHPSDIEAGKVIGNLVYVELKKSKKFMNAFNKMGKSLDVKSSSKTGQ